MTDITASPEPVTNEDYEREIRGMLQEIERLNSLMREDQQAIERLKAESASLRREAEALHAANRLHQEQITRDVQRLKERVGIC